MQLTQTSPFRRRSTDRPPCAAPVLLHRAARRYRAILVKANTEPTELLIALSMLHSAAVLVFFRAVPPLPFPAFFGHALGCLGLAGILGLGLRNGQLRLAFSFFGLIIRAWMAMLYFLRNPHDPAWVSLVMAAAALVWILVRMRCLNGLRPCPWSFVSGQLPARAGVE
jgi:hypothetical protein